MLNLVSKNEIKLCLKRGTIKLVNLESNGQVAIQIGEKIFYFADEDVLLPVPEFIKKKGKRYIFSLLCRTINGPIYSQDDWNMVHFLKEEAFDECLETAKKLRWRIRKEVFFDTFAEKSTWEFMKNGRGLRIEEANADEFLSMLLSNIQSLSKANHPVLIAFWEEIVKLYKELVSENKILPEVVTGTNLEFILQKMHGEDVDMFDAGSESQQNPEGFTNIGAQTYQKLISILEDVGNLTETSLNPVIEKLDVITLEN